MESWKLNTQIWIQRGGKALDLFEKSRILTSLVALLNFLLPVTSYGVHSDISESLILINMDIAIGISILSHLQVKIIGISSLAAAILNARLLPTLQSIHTDIFQFPILENMGTAVEIIFLS